MARRTSILAVAGTDAVITQQRCECGALPRARGGCLDAWFHALAVEQQDPAMYAWHMPLVCSFLLQHPSQGNDRYRDGQFRMLQFYLDRGIEGVHRLTDHQVARNRPGGPGYDHEPLEPYAALPKGPPPAAFAAGILDLNDGSGESTMDGAAAYGDRIERFARATVDAWLAASR